MGNGIKVPRWARLRIPAGGLKISVSDSGIQMTADTEIATAMWPHWLELAIGHWRAADEAHKCMLQAKHAGNNTAVDDALYSEFQSSVQAVIAAAFALDGVFGELLSRIPISQATLTAWRTNRTSRAKRIAEALRLASTIPNQEFSGLRDNIIKLFDWRDDMVHPAVEFEPPISHPELNVGVDPRYLKFSAANATGAVSCLIEALFDAFEQTTLSSRDGSAWAAEQLGILRQILEAKRVKIARQEST